MFLIFGERSDFWILQNGKIIKVNTRLKSEAALGGKQMRYRTLTRVEVEELHKQTDGQDMFAVFSKGENGQEEQYNVAYKEDDEKKIENIIGTQNKPRFR